MDENGLAGLEEERRLAYVGLTRAKQRICISFAANRRVHGSWQSALPSRFITELPEEHVETDGGRRLLRRQCGLSRQCRRQASPRTYDSPGWKRAQANKARRRTRARGRR